MRADSVRSLFEARANYLKSIAIKIHRDKLSGSWLEQMADIMLPYQQGSCPVRILYHTDSAKGEIALGEQWSVAPDDDLLHKLRELFGSSGVQLRF